MRLTAILERLGAPLFATLDGALVADAPALLANAELAGRPLYRGEFEAVGIHLVTLTDEAAIGRFVALFPDTVPAVFWSWPDEEQTLYRHLRGLGKVEVPKAGTNPSDPEFETVVFRHADPASLRQVLPVLDDAQREAFFALSPGIVFEAKGRRGPEIVRASRDGRLLADPIEGATAARVPAASV